jgi:hypothetical protein
MLRDGLEGSPVSGCLLDVPMSCMRSRQGWRPCAWPAHTLCGPRDADKREPVVCLDMSALSRCASVGCNVCCFLALDAFRPVRRTNEAQGEFVVPEFIDGGFEDDTERAGDPVIMGSCCIGGA